MSPFLAAVLHFIAESSVFFFKFFLKNLLEHKFKNECSKVYKKKISPLHTDFVSLNQSNEGNRKEEVAFGLTKDYIDFYGMNIKFGSLWEQSKHMPNRNGLHKVYWSENCVFGKEIKAFASLFKRKLLVNCYSSRIYILILTSLISYSFETKCFNLLFVSSIQIYIREYIVLIFVTQILYTCLVVEMKMQTKLIASIIRKFCNDSASTVVILVSDRNTEMKYFVLIWY